MSEIKQQVFGMLTAALELSDNGDIPAELKDALGAPAMLSTGDMTFSLPGDPVAAADVKILLNDAIQRVGNVVQAHYAEVTAALILAFRELALDAGQVGVDVRAVLQRIAVAYANGQDPASD